MNNINFTVEELNFLHYALLEAQGRVLENTKTTEQRTEVLNRFEPYIEKIETVIYKD